MGHISPSPGKRPHLAQLSREVLWLSLSVSLCVTSTEPKFLPAPSSQGSQQPAKAPPAHWTHTGAAQAHFSSQTSQPLPREFSGCWGQAQPHTLGSTRAQGQALSTTLTGQNQLKAD